MTQIYDASPKELATMAQRYLRDGIPSRATYCYERLMYLGCLRRTGYLRLALVYTKQRKDNAAERVLNRYRAIYKH
nr:MAG TPA: Tetratricopeptide repeat [Caudoviricetes sp.]DAU86976.1 MAG TPA: Tetratricopeptide repeat [Caudoviricetes sp.]